ncbi:MAG: NAD(P)-dependent oxidoreductase [Candidatus Latescibacteria bacterium]|nr:NAD(P)-dependent oxidoreductase [Candidatus Latescibacterota bacterium]MDP7448079.1 NAD(P)-dependent oxidoreductase [Candidatus Latescibacterota bacterium]HJP33103.1 NAD(P)-dependent oxidoreductase [Candidatus Latescibacterota bacterium]
MDNTGFIGLGSMGRGMVANLVGNGVSVLAFDIDAETRKDASGPGVILAENVATVGRDCKRIILSLPDGAVVEEVLFGDGGMAPCLADGTILIDTSTTPAQTSQEIARRLQAQGVWFLDAPVTGMETRAADGTLTVMVGGERSAFDAVESLLEHIGSTVVYMGPSGSGQLTKMVNNVLYNVSVAAMAEMLPLAARLGLEPQSVRRVVSTGSGQSFGFDYFSERVLEGRFEEGYPMGKAFKDMLAISAHANEQKAPMPVVSGALQTYRQALAEGHGDKAKGAMIKVWERVLDIDLTGGS